MLTMEVLIAFVTEGEGVGEFKYELETKHPTTFRPCLRDSSGKFGN